MIRSNYADHQTPQFRVLSDAQCKEIYLTSLECLNRVGVLVNHTEARDLLANAGARVDSNRVYIPAHIIQDALVSAPPTFTLWGRDGQTKLQLRPDHVYFGPGPTCNYFHDPITGERRKARRGDAALTAKVCDALVNIDFVMSLSMFNDVTPMLSPVYEFSEMITNTTKPIVAWSNDPDTLSDIYRIALTVAGSEENLRQKPSFALFTTYDSPLRHSETPLSNLLWAVEHEIPVIYLGGPTVGLESPVTGAAGLVVYLASVLSGLAIAQLKRRGAPTVIGGVPSAMDLRTARPAYGSPEMCLHTAAASDLARYLGIPFMGTAGASESKILDSQAAIEISLQILMASLSGAGMVHDLGFLDCADIGSLALLVMADEIVAMVKRIMRGIEVNSETIMLDLIEKVGPGKHFLEEIQSASLCRREIWIPKLIDRSPYSIWDKKGRQDMEQRVHERLQDIVNLYQPTALPSQVTEQIEGILNEAEGRYHA